MSGHVHVFVWVTAPNGRLQNRCACGQPGLPPIQPAKAARS